MTDIHKADCGCVVHEPGTENEVVLLCDDHDFTLRMYGSETISTEPVVNMCSTCCAYRTKSEWSKLEHIGDMTDEVESLELRNCTCGSTISIVI